MNLLKVVASTDWGADRETLLLIYRSHIRSILDYGCIVYGSARKSYLQMLDPIHHQALRLCLGAFKTSPIESLYVEANEPRLQDRREKLALQYALKIKANPTNIAFDTVYHANFNILYERHTSKISSFGVRISKILSQIQWDMTTIADFSYPQVPTWQLPKPYVDLELCKFGKSVTSPDIYLSYFNERQEIYSDHFPIYTDGSKDGDKVAAAAAIYNTQCRLVRLPSNSSIFSAELTALSLAFEYISEMDRVKKFVIYTDSLSAIQALQSRKWENPLIQKLLLTYTDFLKQNCRVVLCWIPSHIGIKGNETVDGMAKAALSMNICPIIKVPYTDFYEAIKKYIKDQWQSRWTQTHNKLKEIKPNIGPNQRIRLARRDEVVLHRCRIGHSYLTHAYLLKGEDAPFCIPCDQPLTLKHILVDCIDFAHIRDEYYTVHTIDQLFAFVPAINVIQFLKEAGLYNKV